MAARYIEGVAVEVSELRKAKGTNLVQLVPLLKKTRHKQPLGTLSPSAEELLEERILDHVWYPHAPFLELLDVMWRIVLGKSEAHALQAGIVGGKAVLQGTHNTFILPNDPIGSAYAMRHSWRTYFNFGELKAEIDTERTVTLTLSGYADVPRVHAGMILGWAIAAAQLGGAPKATGEFLDKPWESGRKLRYRVTI